MAFTKGPALSLLRQEAVPQAGIPTRGMVTLGRCARLGADQRRALIMWRYKNFVQSGEWALTVIAPTGGVVAGAIVIVGSIVGVAKGAASAGAEVEIRPEGVYDLAKVPADALAAGAIAKVDPATGIVGAAGTKSIGWIVAAAGAGSTTARVRLVPGIA